MQRHYRFKGCSCCSGKFATAYCHRNNVENTCHAPSVCYVPLHSLGARRATSVPTTGKFRHTNRIEINKSRVSVHWQVCRTKIWTAPSHMSRRLSSKKIERIVSRICHPRAKNFFGLIFTSCSASCTPTCRIGRLYV